MALDLDDVCEALAAAVTAAELTVNGQQVTATAFGPDAVTPPHFFTAEYVLTYDKTFGAESELTLTCRLIVARGTDYAAQKGMRELASHVGSNSIPAVFRAARGAPGQSALNGAADDLHLLRAQGPRLYEINKVEHYGLEFTVFVMG